jgi:putative oxidoreductase
MTAKSRNIQTWALTALVVVLLLFSDSMKLSNNPQTAEQFLNWGFSDSFRVFIGVIEVLGAIAMLIPPLATLGASGLSVILLGAVFTHLAHDQATFALVPLVLLGIVLNVAYERRGEVGKLFGADRGHGHGHGHGHAVKAH